MTLFQRAKIDRGQKNNCDPRYGYCLIEGEQSGQSTPFDFEAFIARKQTPTPACGLSNHYFLSPRAQADLGEIWSYTATLHRPSFPLRISLYNDNDSPENMSQGAFARHLHTTSGFVSKLERGEMTATGPALVLLNIIRRRGIEVLR